MKQLVRVVFISLLFASPASAQGEGRGGVGVAVAKVKTTASELESKVSVAPVVGALPREGWGFAFAFNWFSADVKNLGTFQNKLLAFALTLEANDPAYLPEDPGIAWFGRRADRVQVGIRGNAVGAGRAVLLGRPTLVALARIVVLPDFVEDPGADRLAYPSRVQHQW